MNIGSSADSIKVHLPDTSNSDFKTVMGPGHTKSTHQICHSENLKDVTKSESGAPNPSPDNQLKKIELPSEQMPTTTVPMTNAAAESDCATAGATFEVDATGKKTAVQSSEPLEAAVQSSDESSNVNNHSTSSDVTVLNTTVTTIPQTETANLTLKSPNTNSKSKTSLNVPTDSDPQILAVDEKFPPSRNDNDKFNETTDLNKFRETASLSPSSLSPSGEVDNNAVDLTVGIPLSKVTSDSLTATLIASSSDTGASSGAESSSLESLAVDQNISGGYNYECYLASSSSSACSSNNNVSNVSRLGSGTATVTTTKGSEKNSTTSGTGTGSVPHLSASLSLLDNINGSNAPVTVAQSQTGDYWDNSAEPAHHGVDLQIKALLENQTGILQRLMSRYKKTDLSEGEKEKIMRKIIVVKDQMTQLTERRNALNLQTIHKQ